MPEEARITDQRRRLQCTVAPLDTLAPYKFVVVCSRLNGQWLLSRHRQRDTFETQGGHIEPSETPLDAARRELYEESGVTDAEIIPVCDYHGWVDNLHSNGVVFFAKIRHTGTLPKSEMRETALFPELPDDLTYPLVTPVLMAQALKAARQMGLEESSCSRG